MLPSDSTPSSSQSPTTPESSEFEYVSDSGEPAVATSDQVTILPKPEQSIAIEDLKIIIKGLKDDFKTFIKESINESMKDNLDLKSYIKEIMGESMNESMNENLEKFTNTVSVSNSNSPNVFNTNSSQASLTHDRVIPRVSKDASFWMKENLKVFGNLPRVDEDIKKWRFTFDNFFRRYKMLEKVIRYKSEISEIKSTKELRNKFVLNASYNDDDLQQFLELIINILNDMLTEVSGEPYNKVPDETLNCIISEVYKGDHAFYLDRITSYLNESLTIFHIPPRRNTMQGSDVHLFFSSLDYNQYLVHLSPFISHGSAYHSFLDLIAIEFKKYTKGEEHKSLEMIYQRFKHTDEYEMWERKYKNTPEQEINLLVYLSQRTNQQLSDTDNFEGSNDQNGNDQNNTKKSTSKRHYRKKNQNRRKIKSSTLD